eukprot:1298372-Rhodomonas_salina.4
MFIDRGRICSSIKDSGTWVSAHQYGMKAAVTWVYIQFELQLKLEAHPPPIFLSRAAGGTSDTAYVRAAHRLPDAYTANSNTRNHDRSSCRVVQHGLGQYRTSRSECVAPGLGVRSKP